MKCEILAHIGAPATARDDRKYRAIAQAVVGFQPAFRHRIDSSSCHADPYDILSASSGPDCTSGLNHSPSGDLVQSNPCLTRSGYRITGDASDNNHGTALSGAAHAGTPQFCQDRTGPKVSSTSEDERAGYVASNNLKRRRCENSSLSSLLSVVPDSHPGSGTFKSDLGAEGISGAEACGYSLKAADYGEPINQNLDSAPHGSKRHRLAIPSTAPPSFAERISVNTQKQVKPESLRHVQSQQEQRLASSVEQASDSLPLGNNNSGQIERHGGAGGGKKVSGVINSTIAGPRSHRHTSRIEVEAPSMEEAGNNPAKPLSLEGSVHPHPSRGSPPSSSDKEMRLRISRMTHRVDAPPPPTGIDSVVTHTTQILSMIASRLPLAIFFRPHHVARDIRNLERGHWRIPITIAPEEVVQRAREWAAKDELLNRRRKQFDGDSTASRLENLGTLSAGELDLCCGMGEQHLWTARELDKFWTDVSSFIKDGKAGWGVRAVWEEVAANRVDIKIFTWGEVVGYLWLALWVISDKLVSYIPAVWTGCDGKPVVQMSGRRHQKGTLGAWTCKGEGKHGSWGIDSATVPRDIVANS